MKITNITDKSMKCIICGKSADILISDGDEKYAYCSEDFKKSPLLLARAYVQLAQAIEKYRGSKK